MLTAETESINLDTSVKEFLQPISGKKGIRALGHETDTQIWIVLNSIGRIELLPAVHGRALSLSLALCFSYSNNRIGEKKAARESA